MLSKRYESTEDKIPILILSILEKKTYEVWVYYESRSKRWLFWMELCTAANVYPITRIIQRTRFQQYFFIDTVV